MPITFISLNKTFIEKVKLLGFEGYTMRIQDYIPKENRKTYYVSPANSLCFMDGGIDLALSRIIFPGIEQKLKQTVRQLGITNLLGRNYLPIGSSVILEEGNKALAVSPTMLLPQNVANTKNAYYATMAILYNILVNKKENLKDIDILFTSFCCGYGKMIEDEAIQQIREGIRDYISYAPKIYSENIIIKEPNLLEQPKYYQNTEWFPIAPSELVKL